MKKLLLLGLIAVQGASLVAMTEDGVFFEEEEVARAFQFIKTHCQTLKGDAARDWLGFLRPGEARQVVRGKTLAGVPLVVYVTQSDKVDPDLIQVLLEYGADPNAQTRLGTPAEETR